MEQRNGKVYNPEYVDFKKTGHYMFYETYKSSDLQIIKFSLCPYKTQLKQLKYQNEVGTWHVERQYGIVPTW